MRPKIILFLFIGLVLFSNSLQAANDEQQSQKKQLQVLINLLDYMGKDYPNAVKAGKIINQEEYREMKEFSRRALEVFRNVELEVDRSSFSQLSPMFKELQQRIGEKKKPETISKLTSNIRQKILEMNLIEVTPPHWPNLEHGAEVFASHCQSCHGTDGFGDGPLAENLTPAPSNFHDSTLAAELSPLQAYNTIRLGIDGTGMRAFGELSEQEAWDVAFYINSLNYVKEVPSDKQQRIVEAVKDTASLETLTTIPNKKWYTWLQNRDFDPSQAMVVLRSMDPSLEQATRPDKKQSLAHATELLKQSAEAYRQGESGRAGTLALNAYLEGVEPVEAQIKATNPALVSRIENQMISVRSTIKEGKPEEALKEKVEAASASIREAQDIVGRQGYSFWFSAVAAGSILLREGLEAFLVIMVILGVLKSVDAQQSVRYIHGGWLLAVIAGVISWFFADALIGMSSLSRELMEGIGSLVAVVLLIYIGFWLHNRTHASQWTRFIKEKIHRLADENNHWGLAFLSFVVVFREAFESVIFLSSISIKTDSTGKSGILLGTITAGAVVLAVGILLMKVSRKVPVRSLFKYSSFALSILALILVGKGIHEFQEAGYLGIISLSTSIDFPLLGLYPTLQTLAAQLITLVAILGLWQYSNRLAAANE